MPRKRFLFAPLALAAIVAGCGDDLDTRPVRFSYIHPAIVQPNCATSGCHSGLTRTSDLDFDKMSRAYLHFQTYLIPGRPERSELVSLLRGQEPNFPRMPPDGSIPERDIELIERWIAAGALNN